MRTKEYKSENSAVQSQWNTYLTPNILEPNPNKGIVTQDSCIRVYKMRVRFVANIKASRDIHLCEKVIRSLIS